MSLMKGEFKMNEYELYSYDVWGNEEDGYEVNDSYKIGKIELEDTEDNSIIEALKQFGFLKDHALTSDFTIDGENEYTLYVNGEKNNYPYCELRRINP